MVGWQGAEFLAYNLLKVCNEQNIAYSVWDLPVFLTILILTLSSNVNLLSLPKKKLVFTQQI